ncbi:unnamed protein product, partial [Brenthis ino]
MNTLKCSNCRIVIDELLAYVQNKISISNEISLVQICASAFSCEQIEKANNLLLEFLPQDVRSKTVRKGKGKENRLLHDIINVFKVTDPDILPVFVAKDLEKLPPITFDHLDVTKLLKDLTLVQTEIKRIKMSYATIEQLEDVKRECLNGKLTPLTTTKVNMKRGAYCDSGPIGLFPLDDSINTTEQHLEHPNYETSPPTGYQLKYRSINMNKVEGHNEKIQNKLTQCAVNRRDSCNGRSSDDVEEDGANASLLLHSEQTDDMERTKEKQTYAHIVKDHNTNEGWTVVQRKAIKSRNRLIGRMGNVVIESEEKFKAADRKIPLFITNVHKDTAEKDIINYIKKKTQESVTLEKISIKRQCEHNAYKLFVSRSKLPLYLDENLWPQGIIFRRFVHFKTKRSSDISVTNTEVTKNNMTTING